MVLITLSKRSLFLVPWCLFMTCAAQVAAQAQSIGRDSFVQPAATVPSGAAFDKRLPPVLPGEEIAGHSKKIRVWSTGGSPVERGAQVPSLPVPPESNHDSNNISVILDQRSRDSNTHR